MIRGLRYQTTQYGLKGQKRKTVRDAADYFERNRDRMKYERIPGSRLPNWSETGTRLVPRLWGHPARNSAG